ncbi:DUF3054 domain-containing protein [Isoptericola halotolerans]|uniref:DUF3054 family protein n=1 Tax=Isoptericola halotolerans TaxID=300560 RepID=A0ABX2A235_9MICO|nr:hypothetical protein [Isoptericola halotolerans]
MSTVTPARRVWPAAVGDVVSVGAFAVVGTANHGSGGSLGHVLAVAAPFLIGLAVGWLVARAWRAPARLWPTGVVVWAATVVLGLALRPLFVGGLEWSFVLVTAGFLAVTMLGWRTIASLIRRAASSR